MMRREGLDTHPVYTPSAVLDCTNPKWEMTTTTLSNIESIETLFRSRILRNYEENWEAFQYIEASNAYYIQFPV